MNAIQQLTNATDTLIAISINTATLRDHIRANDITLRDTRLFSSIESQTKGVLDALRLIKTTESSTDLMSFNMDDIDPIHSLNHLTKGVMKELKQLLKPENLRQKLLDSQFVADVLDGIYQELCAVVDAIQKQQQEAKA